MATEIVELRVHGVSGMRAEDILDRPLVVRVAGDGHAGFYRPRPGLGDVPGPGGTTLEAYRWGSLTAGRIARTSLLLFLLPFMISNLAVWARPPTTRGWDTAVKALCHVLAVSITAAFVLSVVGSSVDLVGWQCVPYRRCIADRQYLAWLHVMPVGPRLIVLALVPILAIRFVQWVGARSARSFEGFQRAVVGLAQPDEPAEHDRLDAARFWHGEALVNRLRSIHVASAVSVLDLTLILALATPGRMVLAGTLIAGFTLVMAAGLVLLCLPGDSGRHGGPRWGMRGLWLAVAGLSAATAAYAATSPLRRTPRGGGLPGYSDTVSALIVIQVATLAAMVVVVLAAQRHGPGAPGMLFRGLSTPVLGSIAVGLASIYSVALVDRVADFLDRGRIPTPTQVVPAGGALLLPPISYRWAVIGVIVAILVVTLAAVARAQLTRLHRRSSVGRVIRRDYPDAPRTAQHQLHVVEKTIIKSRVLEQLAPFVVVYLTLSLLGLAFTALDLAGVGPAQLITEAGGRNGVLVMLVEYLTDVGTYSLGLLLLGVLAFSLVAFRTAETQRMIGTLWDLGTFWPRAVHPFAPPCYAERAVPELTRRIGALARRGEVLLSGHSQGSVLAVAAILQLPPETLHRVALLTYGSPLRRLYARLSPAYFGQDILHEVGDRIRWRWRNLWRDTDAVGGPVFPAHDHPTRPGRPPAACPAAQVDVRLRDPRGVTVDPDDTVPPPIEAHWPYHTDPTYGDVVRQLTRPDRHGQPDHREPAG